MTNFKFLWKWTGVFVLTILLGAPPAFAQEQCNAEGVVFGFFNGVKTTLPQARDARRLLEALHGPATPKGEPITYELFYNDTQGFADFVETFEQRLQEQNGLLAGRFELFFSATQGEGSWWDALIKAIPALGDLLKSLFDTFLATLLRGLTSQLGSPNMAEVSARHQAQIDHRASLNQKMLFLAHSQGNLFVNKAYTHAVGKSGAEYVRVVHVAPASPGLSGRHTLADKDIVINGLRLTGTVAPNTDEIVPYSDRPPGLNGSRDLIGHGLLEIYLNPALPTAGRIRNDVLTALHELDAAPRRPMPPYPDFVMSLPLLGPQPASVRSPDERSHSLNRVVYRGSQTAIWRREQGSWEKRYELQPPVQASGWSSTHFEGPEVDGSKQCQWGDRPIEGWEPQLVEECVYERVPKHYYKQLRSVPDELAVHANAPDGTIVSLNTMTYSDVSLHSYSGDLPPSIAFLSGVYSSWTNEFQNKREWTEPYHVKYGNWLSTPELEAWLKAQAAHEAEQFRLYAEYLERKAEYDRRRLLCESPA